MSHLLILRGIVVKVLSSMAGGNCPNQPHAKVVAALAARAEYLYSFIAATVEVLLSGFVGTVGVSDKYRETLFHDPIDSMLDVSVKRFIDCRDSRAQVPANLRCIEPEPAELTQDEGDMLLREILRAVSRDRDLDPLTAVLLVPGLLAGLEDEPVGQQPPLQRSTVYLGAHDVLYGCRL